jgi:hypothetical protein
MNRELIETVESLGGTALMGGILIQFSDTAFEQALKKMYEAGVEAEREACAQIAEYKLDNKGLTAPDSPKEWWNYACQNIRDAIRARGQA